MSLLIVPLLYPDWAELLNFSDPHFRITSGLTTRPERDARALGFYHALDPSASIEHCTLGNHDAFALRNRL
jgi:hypothetical protein